MTPPRYTRCYVSVHYYTLSSPTNEQLIVEKTYKVVSDKNHDSEPITTSFCEAVRFVQIDHISFVFGDCYLGEQYGPYGFH